MAKPAGHLHVSAHVFRRRVHGIDHVETAALVGHEIHLRTGGDQRERLDQLGEVLVRVLPRSNLPPAPGREPARSEYRSHSFRSDGRHRSVLQRLHLAVRAASLHGNAEVPLGNSMKHTPESLASTPSMRASPVRSVVAPPCVTSTRPRPVVRHGDRRAREQLVPVCGSPHRARSRPPRVRQRRAVHQDARLAGAQPGALASASSAAGVGDHGRERLHLGCGFAAAGPFAPTLDAGPNLRRPWRRHLWEHARGLFSSSRVQPRASDETSSREDSRATATNSVRFQEPCAAHYSDFARFTRRLTPTSRRAPRRRRPRTRRDPIHESRVCGRRRHNEAEVRPAELRAGNREASPPSTAQVTSS